MSFSFWPLDDTIDKKHLGCCGGGGWGWWRLRWGAWGRKGWEEDTEESCIRKWQFTSIMDIWSRQMSCQSCGECLTEQKIQHTACSGVTFDLNVHQCCFWQNTESSAWLYRSGAWVYHHQPYFIRQVM